MAEEGRRWEIERLVSGGQTGVDRGALDAAIALGIEHGGWCPRGRLSESGRIPRRYQLRESESSEYWVRTERNVVDSDGTLILHRGRVTGGTQFTYRMTRKHGKPSLSIDLTRAPAPEEIHRWLAEHGIRVMNVAGPRESSCPGIAQQTRQLIESLFIQMREGL